MTSAERERFDRLLEDVLEELPAPILRLIDELPLIVEDRPSDKLVKQLIAEGTLSAEHEAAELCGLHTGVGLTERSIEDPGGWGIESGSPAQEHILIFREGIVALAGGFEGLNADDEVYEEIRITVLHEIGHHFGLDEDDLDELGYA